MPTLGVVVFSLPGMKNPRECLQSVAWADRVLLVETGDPAAITAGEFPSLRIHHADSPAQAQTYLKDVGTDWVLQLWAEERLEPALTEELRQLCRDGSLNTPASYRIAIRSYILGAWAAGSLSGPGPALRFSRDGQRIRLGWWTEQERAPILGRGWIGDYGCSDLSRAVAGVQELSDFWADSLRRQVAPPGALKTALCSLTVFIKMLAANFARGIAGVTLSALASYAVLLSGAKLWEARHVDVAKKRRA
ncbi:MAG TPA: hypothetical protein VGL11_18905 [Candidatus Binatia bacterium]|jgi:hypothetical protein